MVMQFSWCQATHIHCYDHEKELPLMLKPFTIKKKKGKKLAEVWLVHFTKLRNKKCVYTCLTHIKQEKGRSFQKEQIMQLNQCEILRDLNDLHQNIIQSLIVLVDRQIGEIYGNMIRGNRVYKLIFLLWSIGNFVIRLRSGMEIWNTLWSTMFTFSTKLTCERWSTICQKSQLTQIVVADLEKQVPHDYVTKISSSLQSYCFLVQYFRQVENQIHSNSHGCIKQKCFFVRNSSWSASWS